MTAFPRMAIYRVDWLESTIYVDAWNHGQAKARAMRSAQDAGFWSPGQSLRGLRCRLATWVPCDAPISQCYNTPRSIRARLERIRLERMRQAP